LHRLLWLNTRFTNSYKQGAQRMYKNRLNIVRSTFELLGIDTLWVIQPQNRRYISGFKAPDGQLDESSGSLFINKDKALLLTDSRYTIEAEEEAVNFEVITHKEGLIHALPDIFNQLQARKLGFEAGYLMWDLYEKAKKQASLQSPAVELVATAGVVEDIRKIKSKEEIDLLSLSALLMGDILSKVIEEIKPHQTEKSIAWKIESLIHERDGDGVSFPPIVASGENAAVPHATPTNKKIVEHEPIILDVGSILNDYCSDMTRTIFLEGPSSYFKQIYDIVREAQISAINSIKIGMDSFEADSIARDVIKKAGFGEFFCHSLGHGIGLVPHEKPYLGPRNSEVLQEGMVFTIEPGIYIPGKGGVRLEEMVVLEKEGARVLTTNADFL